MRLEKKRISIMSSSDWKTLPKYSHHVKDITMASLSNKLTTILMARLWAVPGRPTASFWNPIAADPSPWSTTQVLRTYIVDCWPLLSRFSKYTCSGENNFKWLAACKAGCTSHWISILFAPDFPSCQAFGLQASPPLSPLGLYFYLGAYSLSICLCSVSCCVSTAILLITSRFQSFSSSFIDYAPPV